MEVQSTTWHELSDVVVSECQRREVPAAVAAKIRLQSFTGGFVSRSPGLPYDVVGDWKLKSVDYIDEKLKTPKYETMYYELVTEAVSTEPPFEL
ncbi:hypothetical protein RHGRI_026644 [Rhododendron griersonianum]|uniref:Uncharacterized protein n=1 Tax=Rhododendron griersonianum TaxID=479676 RepID=A0AAV6IX82_9ERIC|nr:hypothetical protein RHGRI_026644 [Rhododendron griersonianum]